MSETSYRTKHQIVAQILDFLGEEKARPKRKSHIMGRVYLSYPQLVEYLSALENNSLMVKTDVGLYAITSKGADWLTKYKKVPAIDFEKEASS